MNGASLEFRFYLLRSFVGAALIFAGISAGVPVSIIGPSVTAALVAFEVVLNQQSRRVRRQSVRRPKPSNISLLILMGIYYLPLIVFTIAISWMAIWFGALPEPKKEIFLGCSFLTLALLTASAFWHGPAERACWRVYRLNTSSLRRMTLFISNLIVHGLFITLLFFSFYLYDLLTTSEQMPLLYRIALCILVMETCVGLASFIYGNVFFGQGFHRLELGGLHWFFTLACYPPFNFILIVAPAGYEFFYLPPTDMFLSTASLFRDLIWATFLIALVLKQATWGLQFSVLVNRGITSRGLFSVSRHPSYQIKVFHNILLTAEAALRAATGIHQLIGVAMLALIYYFRGYFESAALMRIGRYRSYAKSASWSDIIGTAGEEKSHRGGKHT